MINRELFICLIGFCSGQLVEDMALKFVVTVIAMVAGTTASRYWSRYLDRREQKSSTHTKELER